MKTAAKQMKYDEKQFKAEQKRIKKATKRMEKQSAKEQKIQAKINKKQEKINLKEEKKAEKLALKQEKKEIKEELKQDKQLAKSKKRAEKLAKKQEKLTKKRGTTENEFDIIPTRDSVINDILGGTSVEELEQQEYKNVAQHFSDENSKTTDDNTTMTTHDPSEFASIEDLISKKGKKDAVAKTYDSQEEPSENPNSEETDAHADAE